jgi:sulfopyruvate decarboxylase subunit alpha
MTTLPGTDAERLASDLQAAGAGPFLSTPCGVLAPLHAALLARDLTTVAREDTALGLAAGIASAGRWPCVLMQNSGFGQSVNAVASLLKPYEFPVLMVISLRGTGRDHTLENKGMGSVTRLILNELGVPTIDYAGSRDCGNVAQQLARWRRATGPSAVLVHPEAFGWVA